MRVILYGLIGLTLLVGVYATAVIYHNVTCHGQCAYTKNCQERCMAKSYCPAADVPDYIQPAQW